ncbi:MAG: glucose-1-phosphate cytidylyltransferase [Candidatus Binataceae bacterium]
MKVVILAGGLGTRLREETEVRPKPMVEIGGRPILWHIMKTYAAFGHHDFIVCLGYKGDVIRDYFLNYKIRHSDFTVELETGNVEVHSSHDEGSWRVTLVETGQNTQTAGRLRRIKKYLDGQPFMATYGDGVASLDLQRLVAFHRASNKLATVTAVRPSSRFGELSFSDGVVHSFREKPQVNEGWINGGFFVFEPKILDLIAGDGEVLETELLVKLAETRALAVFKHEGFWQCMDTSRETLLLNDLWAKGQAPWALWRK